MVAIKFKKYFVLFTIFSFVSSYVTLHISSKARNRPSLCGCNAVENSFNIPQIIKNYIKKSSELLLKKSI